MINWNIHIPNVRTFEPLLLKKIADSLHETTANNFSFNYIKLLRPVEEICEGMLVNSDTLTSFDTARLAFILRTSIDNDNSYYIKKLSPFLSNSDFAGIIVKKSVKQKYFIPLINKIVLVGNQCKGVWNIFYQNILNSNEFIKSKHLNKLKELYENPDYICNEIAEKSFNRKIDYRVLWLDEYSFPSERIVLEKYYNKIDRLLWKLFTNNLINIKKESDARFFITILLQINDNNSNFIPRFKHLIKQANISKIIRKPFIEHVKGVIGSPPAWDKYDDIDNATIRLYEEMLGLVRFRYFEIIANIIYDEIKIYDDKDAKLLNNRTVFWSNYYKSFYDIKIYLPQKYHHLLNSNRDRYSKDEYTITDELIDQVGIAEGENPICFLYSKEILIIEFFKESKSDTVIIPHNNSSVEYYTHLLTASQIISLRENAIIVVKHHHGWMTHLLSCLKSEYSINPDYKEKFKMPKNPIENGFGKTTNFMPTIENDMKSYDEIIIKRI